MSITANDIAEIVRRSIADHHYELPEAGTTIGVPWPVEKEAHYVELLKQSLVPPRLERVMLAETSQQIAAEPREYAEYWIVIDCGSHAVWYDATAEVFGLAQRFKGELVSIGVRGDLVSAFCAM